MSKFINGKLLVRSHSDIRDYCNKKNIETFKFNIPVTIDPEIKSCKDLFRYCYRFNQSVEIPEGVLDCEHMFADCYAFNQKVVLPTAIQHCDHMFAECKSFNQPIELPDNGQSVFGMFKGCTNFNQEITIPKTIISACGMFIDCPSFTKTCTILYDIESDYMYWAQDLYYHYFNEIDVSVNFDLEQALDMIFRKGIDVIFSDEFTIKYFNDIMKYTFDHSLIEMRARLLQFKHDHWNEFPDPLAFK